MRAVRDNNHVFVCRWGGDVGRTGGQHHPPVPGGRTPGRHLGGVVLQVGYCHIYSSGCNI